MYILALDTSTQAATVAIAQDRHVLTEVMLDHNRTHSQKILPLVERALGDVELDIADMDVFAVGIGPGSFTGLRIGVAMAKTFAFTLGKQLVGESTLAMLAENVPSLPGCTVVPLLYARADEVFASAFRDGACVMSDCVLSVHALADHLSQSSGSFLFVGDGVSRFADVLSDRLGERAQSAPPHLCHQRAASLAALAYARAQAGRLDDPMTLAPAYLRPSQAEREFG